MTDTYIIVLSGVLFLLGIACLMIAYVERKEKKRDARKPYGLTDNASVKASRNVH